MEDRIYNALFTLFDGMPDIDGITASRMAFAAAAAAMAEKDKGETSEVWFDVEEYDLERAAEMAMASERVAEYDATKARHLAREVEYWTEENALDTL